MDLAHPSPKQFVVTTVVAAVVAWVPWATVVALFAETNWPDVGRDFVALLLFIATGYFAYVAKKNSGEARTEAKEARVEAQVVGEKMETLHADAKVARRAAQVAVQVAVASDKKGDLRDIVLDKIAGHTNGEFAALKAEKEELQKRVEALLLEKPPPDLEEAIIHAAETIDNVADAVKAPKSGTRIGKSKKPRDPDSRERHDDTPSGEFKAGGS